MTGQAQDLAVVGQSQDHLGERERDELGVGDAGRAAWARRSDKSSTNT
jgi:hypothetical protein